MQRPPIETEFDPSELAEKYGTPLYILNLDALERNFQRLSQALSSVARDHKILYAVKANPLLTVLQKVMELGGGAEVVSLGEMEAARRARFNPTNVVFNGPGKTRREIEEAIRWGVASINVESVGELEAVIKTSQDISKGVNVGFRINPGVGPRTHAYLGTGQKGSKFGLDLRSFRRALKIVRKSSFLHPACIHMHIGSQVRYVKDFRVAYRELLRFVRLFKRALGTHPDMIDLGGGLGLDYSSGELRPQPDNYARSAIKPLLSSGDWPSVAKLVVEPGRSLVAQAGMLATRVLYEKKSYESRWLIVDAAMNDFMRTALYSERHRVVNVSRTSGRRERCLVGGPVCESGDSFGAHLLPATHEGDLLLLLDAGAYGSCMSSNYNGRTRPATVAVSRGRAWLCERGEALDDLFARQLPDLDRTVTAC